MESILDAIGNTPVVPLRRCGPANGATLLLKLEYCNPTGSMKDRMALAMIEGGKHDGLLSPGETVVEYTGGSTGPAVALVCRAKGYRALIVIADCFTEERFQLFRALGADIDVVPSVEGPKVTAQDIRNMVARAGELAQNPGHYATDQFNNPYIIPNHRDWLGREIWEQTEGRVTAFCHGLGTAALSSVCQTRSSPTVSSSRRTSRLNRLRSPAAGKARFSFKAGRAWSCRTGIRRRSIMSNRSGTPRRSR